MMDEHGMVIAPGVLRFMRLLPGPVERVWAYLTESEKRGQWLASGEMELYVGGRVTLNFRHTELTPGATPVPERFQAIAGGVTGHGRITAIDAPHLLAFTWNDGPDQSEVRFELTPQARDVLLVLTHTKQKTRASIVDHAGGWHTHLGILVAKLNGRVPPPIWDTVIAAEEEYGKRIPPDAAG